MEKTNNGAKDSSTRLAATKLPNVQRSEVLVTLLCFSVVLHLIFNFKETSICFNALEVLSLSSSFSSSSSSSLSSSVTSRVATGGHSTKNQHYYTPTKNEIDAISKMIEHSFTRIKPSTQVNLTRFFHGDDSNERCALLFYGLPRSFFSMTLPSVIENILIPNAVHDCHMFVHYHYLTNEGSGRSGPGGKLNPDEVFLLEEAARQIGVRVHEDKNYTPTIRFANYTDDVLWATYGSYLNRTRHEIDDYDSEKRLLYLPWRDKSYTFQQLDNIAKMWHGQKSAFELMEQTASELGLNYTRMGFFRSDVFFVTPIDILTKGNSTTFDYENQCYVLPNFARFPENDRMFMGPHRAVKVWATTRFELIKSHVILTKRRGHGWGVQSEWFLDQTVLPAIERQNVRMVIDPSICFLRVRPEENVWTREGCPSEIPAESLVPAILNRPCQPKQIASSGGRGNINCPLQVTTVN